MFTERGAGYRPFLDGLRAIAVGGVIAYHLDERLLPGGFLGVDLFFVLSGYLITTLLITEHARRGRIDLFGFWSRRVRRLLPALLLVLVAVAIGVAVAGDEVATEAARGDMLATLFYVANWRFIATDESYFAAFAAPSPVRHAWSLAIEEQFYLAWPLVVGLVLGRFGLRSLLGVVVFLGTASVAALWLLFGSAADPSRAYYGTDARIYQLLVGAALAVGLSGGWRSRILHRARPATIPALAVILAQMVFLTDEATIYYHGGGLAFALATAVLIGGLEGGGRLGRLLSLRPLVAIGLISYGLYLWHWPVILAVNELLGATSALGPAAVAVAVTLILSTASYVLVERPIRRDARIGRWELRPRRLLAVVPAASASVAVVIVLATGGARLPDWATPPGVAVSSRAPLAGATPRAPVMPSGDVDARLIGLVGDSVMVSAVPALQAEALARGWRVIDASFAGCPVGYDPLFSEQGVLSSFDKRCRGVRGAHEALLAAGPDVVLWHDLQSTLARRTTSGELLLPGSEAWIDDLVAEWESVLHRFLEAGSEVVIVMPPFRSTDPAGCAGSPRAERCAEVQYQDAAIRAATEVLFDRIRGRPGVHLTEIDRYLCPAGYPCPTSVDGVEVRDGPWDQTHFTEAGAAWIAPLLLDMVEAAAGPAAPNAGRAP
ncbi:MAG TPA: acyltransferase family protein [candidate division Zixibacteria bacterium]|nr:acyltransferase family protein [candidate division Zixibacteria bacterium]